MNESNVDSEISTKIKKQRKPRDNKRKFTFVNKKIEKDDKSPKEGQKSEANLSFDYKSLAFKTTSPLSYFPLTKEEKELLGDLLTDIEQENNIRMYKYLHNILLLVLLFIGCALYFTIVVPVLCFLFLIYLICKRKTFRNSIFEKIKRAMLEIEEEYNQLLDRYFIVIFVSNGEDVEKKEKKDKKKEKEEKKIIKSEEKDKNNKSKEDFQLKLTIVKKNFSVSGHHKYLAFKSGNKSKFSEMAVDSARPLKHEDEEMPKINILSPSNLLNDEKLKEEADINKEKLEKLKGKNSNENSEKLDEEAPSIKEIKIFVKDKKKKEPKKISKFKAKKETEEKEEEKVEIKKSGLSDGIDKSESIRKIEADMRRLSISEEEKEIEDPDIPLKKVTLTSVNNLDIENYKRPDAQTLRKDFQSFSQEVISNKKINLTDQNNKKLENEKKEEKIENIKNKGKNHQPSLTPQHRIFSKINKQQKSLGRVQVDGKIGEFQKGKNGDIGSQMISGFKKNEFTSSFVRENLDTPVNNKKLNKGKVGNIKSAFNINKKNEEEKKEFEKENNEFKKVKSSFENSDEFLEIGDEGSIDELGAKMEKLEEAEGKKKKFRFGE